MPWNIGETINWIADSVLTSRTINAIASNPLYTSILIVVIIMIVVALVFRDADTEEGLLVLCLRVGFWSLLAIVGFMVIHNKVLIKEYGGSGDNYDLFSGYSLPTSSSNNIENGLGTFTLADAIVPVEIKTDLTD